MTILFFLALWAVAFEVSQLVIYGKWIPESELDAFLSKHLDDYHINSEARNMMFSSGMAKDLPFIARRSFRISAAWHIDGYGTIPRWSKWNKKLMARYRELEGKGQGHKSLKNL